MTNRTHWPQWLREAQTHGARVKASPDGTVVWYGGDWHDGDWYGVDWLRGVWRGGVWHGGVWHGGEWHGGEWLRGVWRGGVWHGGVWHGGDWRGGERRLLYMATMIGIVFDAHGWATAYRTTRADGTGRHTSTWTQPAGEWYDPEALPAGNGTCTRGIHVTTAARAWTYFGVDPTCQFWRVRFRREDLLDCDGEKARIRGGHFEPIPCPFACQDTPA